MPLVDMPLEELYKYNGRNPCPEDIDSYWDSSIAEMKAVDAQVELVPRETACSSIECFHLYFTGVGGAKVHAKYMRPKNAPAPHPGVVCFHGYTGNCGDWTGYYSWLAQGYSVAALDCRGQGGLSEDVGGVKGNTQNGHIIRGLDDPDPKKLLFRSIFLDCAQLAGILTDMPEVDAERVGATGASQGGGLTLACAALEPRVKLAAPIYPFLCDYQRVWEMDLAAGAYQELRTFFRLFDPTHEREKNIFTKLGYIDIQHIAKRIRAEVMLSVGLMDTICPPSTQFAPYNKITSKKSLRIYPDYGHEGIPGVNDTIFEFMCRL